MGEISGKSQEKTNPPIHFHGDLVQAIGKVPIDITLWDLDSASFSGHKLGGPRGIGLLYLKKPLESLYAGGEQEGHIRPGTENTTGALALADVLERRAKPDIVSLEGKKAAERFKYLIGELKKIKRCAIIPEDRKDDDPRFSPWILQVRFRDVPGAVMVRALDDAGIAVSTGSACSSNSPERPVLAAMGLDEAARLEGIRISQGWSTEISDLDALLSGIERTLAFL
jgi:cysteine desulfurase